MLDVFNADAFSVVSLTAAINKLPYKPSRLGDMGLFNEQPITTTVAVVEEQSGKLVLIPTAARGTMPNVVGGKNRKVRSFVVPHMPLNSLVMADDVQNVRAFGSEDQVEAVATVVNDRLASLRQSHEYTHEWHRLGAIKGVILDADGVTEVHDLFDEFGLSQDEVEFDFTDSSLSVKLNAMDVKRKIETALGLTPSTGVHAICGDGFFDSLVTNAEVKEAYAYYLDNAFARDDQRQGFEYPRGVTWENYRGKIGSTPFVADDECHFFPLGVPELFQEILAPANFVETVNTPGQRVYAKQENLRFNVGVELHTQSNLLAICTRPKCLIKGTALLSSGS